MPPLRQKRFARLLLGLGVVSGLLWLARLDYAHKISTDVLDLIPADERSPELAMVRTLAGERQARVAVFALTVPGHPTESAETLAERRSRTVGAFVAALGRSPAFAEAMPMEDTAARNALGGYVFRERFDLLLPGWLEARAREHAAAGGSGPWGEWLAERTAATLEAYLAKPEALAFQSLVPADPLLLVPGFAEQVQGFAGQGKHSGADGTALIWARATASPLREEGQEPVFAAVNGALAAARNVAPQTSLRWTAISRFAAESRRRIEREMSGLNLISLLAVFAVAAISVRRVLKALHLLPVILCSLLGAWVATTVVFERVHVLVFVVGSLLGGVAVDYGFYLYLQPPRRPGETYREKVGRLLKPLLASVLTTVIGFSLLLFSELPLIRQLGVFVSAGLLCALAAALLWFAQVDEPFLETRAFIAKRMPDDASGRRRHFRWILAACAVVALSGPWLLHWHDDIRELEIPAPALWAEDAEVRGLSGENSAQTIYLTRGATVADARTALDRFLGWHGAAFPGSVTASLGSLVPATKDWAAVPGRLAGLGDFEPQLRAALARHGFEPGEFEAFFSAWRAWSLRPARPTPEDLARGLARELRGPLGLLMSVEPGGCWFATIADHGAGASPPAETATVEAAQLQTLNVLFGRYRASALRLSIFGLGLVGLSVFVLYRPRRGIRIFALPCGSCLFAFGVFGLAGQTMNLFHLLGAFLGVCLSHNYAIFSAENAARGDAPPPSIRLSALTTAASFGVLALSHIPVVAALGTTVALIVLTALAAVELEPFGRSAEAAGAPTTRPK